MKSSKHQLLTENIKKSRADGASSHSGSRSGNHSRNSKRVKKETKQEQTIENQKNTDKYFCVFPGNGYKIIREAMVKKHGWIEIKKEDIWNNHSMNKINFIWKPCCFNYKMFCNIDNILHRSQIVYQREKTLDRELVVNHLENHREITTKTGLIRCLKYYYKDNVNFIENGYTVFDSTPTSFVVSSKLETHETHQFNKRFDDLAKENFHPLKEKVPEEQCKMNTWLVKPANENQEQSIKFSYWVIQKYLEKPLLYKGRKFDIRVWAFAQSNLDFYFYDEGYIRTSSAGYDMTNFDDEYTHLTNNCLQIKNKETYGQHEEGNVLSFETFQVYLTDNFPQYNLNFDEHFLKRMKDIAIDCYMSAKNILNPNKRRNSFEFFGFDFMIDEDFRVWLIEVNTNPYIGIHNKSLKHVVPNMFEDLFKIVLDPVYQNSVSQNDIEQIGNDTKFDLLYSRMRGINKRRPPLENIYPIPELNKRKNYSKRPLRKPTKRHNDMSSPMRKPKHEISNINQDQKLHFVKTQVKRDDLSKSHIEKQKDKFDAQDSNDLNNFEKNMVQIQIETLISQDRQKSEDSRQKIMGALTQKQNTMKKIHFENQSFINEPTSFAEENKLSRKPSVPKLTDLKIQKIKPSKLITEQVKNLDKSSPFLRTSINEIQHRIIATMKSWELFSQEQLNDANNALRILLTNMNFDTEEQMQILTQLSQLISSFEVPLDLRVSISQNILLIFKNKGFIKYFLNDIDNISSIIPLYKVLIDKEEEEDDENYADSSTIELKTTCSQIMIQLMSLNNSRFYIPGETSEKAKMRQQTMDLGILIVMTNIYIITENEQLKQYIFDEFIDRIQESDIDYHFENNHRHYQIVQSVISDTENKQSIDQLLHERVELLRASREREQKLQMERRKKKEEKELQNQIENGLALQEKRELAEKRMQQRIRELAKAKNEEIKAQLQIKEELEKESQMRKEQLVEYQKKKQEVRRQHQLSMMRKAQEEDKQIEMKLQKDRDERAQQRQVEMEMWHRRKRLDDKRKNDVSFTKVMNRKGSSFSNQAHSQLETFNDFSNQQMIGLKQFQQKKRSVGQEQFYSVKERVNTKNHKMNDIIEESNRKAIDQLRKLQQKSQVTNMNRLKIQAENQILQHGDIAHAGLRIVKGDKKFDKTPQNQDLNSTQIEIHYQNDFIPPVIYLRGRGGATVVNSPNKHQNLNSLSDIHNQKFKKKNEQILKKGDRLIEESNNFIRNLTKKALEETSPKNENNFERMVAGYQGQTSMMGTVENHGQNPYTMSNQELLNNSKLALISKKPRHVKNSSEQLWDIASSFNDQVLLQMKRDAQMDNENEINRQTKTSGLLSQSGSAKQMKRNVTQRNSSYFENQIKTQNQNKISYTEDEKYQRETTSNKNLSVRVKKRINAKETTFEDIIQQEIDGHQADKDINFQNTFISDTRQKSFEHLDDQYKMDLVDLNESIIDKDFVSGDMNHHHNQIEMMKNQSQDLIGHSTYISKNTLPRIDEFIKYKTDQKPQDQGSATHNSFKAQQDSQKYATNQSQRGIWNVKKQFNAKYPSMIPEDIPGQYSSIRYKQQELQAATGSSLSKSQTKKATKKLIPIKINAGDSNRAAPIIISPNQMLESEASKTAINSKGAISPANIEQTNAPVTIINNEYTNINFNTNIQVQKFYNNVVKESDSGGLGTHQATTKRKKKKKQQTQQALVKAQAAHMIYSSQIDASLVPGAVQAKQSPTKDLKFKSYPVSHNQSKADINSKEAVQEKAKRIVKENQKKKHKETVNNY